MAKACHSCSHRITTVFLRAHPFPPDTALRTFPATGRRLFTTTPSRAIYPSVIWQEQHNLSASTKAKLSGDEHVPFDAPNFAASASAPRTSETASRPLNPPPRGDSRSQLRVRKANRRHGVETSRKTRMRTVSPQRTAKPKPFRSNPEPPPHQTAPSPSSENGPTEQPAKEQWQTQKAAMQRILAGEKWNPRRRLSPDAMSGMRGLHAHDPETYTTPMLANHFNISPEAVRRILKSKWRPSTAAEEDERRERWERRGERIWTTLAGKGVKVPKKWREKGIGKKQDENGEDPTVKL